MKNFVKIMEYIFSPDFHYPMKREIRSLLREEGLKMQHLKEGELLVYNGMPRNTVYILLNGSCQAEKYNTAGEKLNTPPAHAIQIYGLYEALLDPPITHHATTLRCITDCDCLCIPTQRYMAEMWAEPVWMWRNLQLLSDFIARIFRENDMLLLNSSRDKLLLLVYQNCQNTAFPAIIRISKEELAHSINVNLRTLYRQLNLLYEEGLLSSHRGKLLVTEEQYRKIEALLSPYLPQYQ